MPGGDQTPVETVVGTPVEFCVLGPVGIRIDGRVVDVGHARQQCVLAALLVDVNCAVPADRLLERGGVIIPRNARGGR